MGATCGLKTLIDSLESADVIAGIGIAVNSGLAIWIVRTIQDKLTNKRVLKDHFINEIKEIRNEYRTCLSSLYSNKTHPKLVTPWFKLMNIKINDLMDIISDKYKIDKNILAPYQNDLPELITSNEDFEQQFRLDKPVNFSERSRIHFLKFQQDHSKLFNDIIVKINDAS